MKDVPTADSPGARDRAASTTGRGDGGSGKRVMLQILFAADPREVLYGGH
jgi:hypothetical protein